MAEGLHPLCQGRVCMVHTPHSLLALLLVSYLLGSLTQEPKITINLQTLKKKKKETDW